MTSTFRLLLAAMPDIAQACERIQDPQLRAMAFDTLVQAARDGGDPYSSSGLAPETSYTGFAPVGSPTYDPTSTRVDNGLGRS